MRSKIIVTILLWTTILGCVLCAWSWITGETLQVAVSRTEIANGIYMYKIDLLGYIRNIQDTLGTITTIGAVKPNAPTFNWSDALLVFKSLGKVVFYVINWIIYAFQLIIIIPTKFILYTIICTLSIMGMDGSKIMTEINKMYMLNIPYLQYSWLG